MVLCNFGPYKKENQAEHLQKYFYYSAPMACNAQNISCVRAQRAASLKWRNNMRIPMSLKLWPITDERGGRDPRRLLRPRSCEKAPCMRGGHTTEKKDQETRRHLDSWERVGESVFLRRWVYLNSESRELGRKAPQFHGGLANRRPVEVGRRGSCLAIRYRKW